MLERLGPYDLIARLGMGGMAEVFLASKADGARLVVKRMLAHLVHDKDAVAMFVDEGRLGSQLVSPRIVQTLDIGEHNGVHYIALEYIDGADLGALEGRAKNAGHPLPLSLCAHIVARAAEALHDAHVAVDSDLRPLRVIHRDVSPSNVLVSKTGAVKVADFGIARSAMQQAKTATGILKGKLSYMSPEQIDAAPLDARTDVCSLGVVLYELITRRRLYAGLSEVQTIRQISQAAPPPPSRDNPAVDAELDAILAQALARKPAERLPSAQKLAQLLDAWAVPKGGTAEALRRFLDARPALFQSGTTATGTGDGSVGGNKRAVDVDSEGRTTPGLRRVKTPSDKGGLRLQSKEGARPRELLLYVEDEHENREVAALRLRRSYQLLVAADDVEACAILRERGKDLAAILMDIQLKGSALDGIQLTRLLRGALPKDEMPPHARDVPVLPRVPIIFVTAYGARYTEKELIAAGGNKLVSKPVNFAELTLALVDLHLSRASRG